MFQVSTAKREILEKLAQQDWSPTDLATELNKSPETIYNHLNDLAQLDILTKQKVEAKTRPKTEYSIGSGFIQYIAVLPHQVKERTLRLDENKKVFFRIWNIPQAEFHPYLEELWITLRNRNDITAIGVYGSVARGYADQDSDIDLLLLTEKQDAVEPLESEFGSIRLQGGRKDSKLCMTEVYSCRDYRNSIAHDSTFLNKIQDDLHIIYDPDQLLNQPEESLQ